jgi:hypothetical protein
VNPLTYNSFSLNDANYMTESVDHTSAPERRLSVFNLARSNGAVITDSMYGTKTIPVRGKVVDTTVSALETRLGVLQAALSVQDKNLDIGFAGSTRRYVCTPSKVVIDRPVDAAPWASYQIEFLATDYGRDTTVTTLVSTSGITTTPSVQGLTIGGSAPEQKLRIQVTVTSATGLIGKFISLTNSTTGEVLTVTRTWVAGDVLIVDTDAHTVKVNGTAVDFTGAFPNFSPGSSNLSVANNFTTRSLGLVVDHYKRYL